MNIIHLVMGKQEKVLGNYPGDEKHLEKQDKNSAVISQQINLMSISYKFLGFIWIVFNKWKVSDCKKNKKTRQFDLLILTFHLGKSSPSGATISLLYQ